MHTTPTSFILGLAFVCAIVGASCSAPQTDSSEDTVQMKDQAVSEIEQQRAEQVARRTQTAEQVPEAEEEEIVVEMFEVRSGEPARAENGLEVRMLSAGPDWKFELDHHGRKATAQHTGTPLYIEGEAFGNLYVLSQLGEVVQITLRPTEDGKTLTPDQAFEIARRERASRLGCDGPREETGVNENGTAVLRILDASGAESCRIVVGLHTQQIVDL